MIKINLIYNIKMIRFFRKEVMLKFDPLSKNEPDLQKLFNQFGLNTKRDANYDCMQNNGLNLNDNQLIFKCSTNNLI